MKKLFYPLWVLLLLPGCSPKVTTEVLTHSFGPIPTNEVMLLTEDDSMACGATTIGHLEVSGRGVSVSSQYSRILGMAVAETAQHGGNMLIVADRQSKKENRMRGTMARTDSAVVDSLVLSARRVYQLQQAELPQAAASPQATVYRQPSNRNGNTMLGGTFRISVGPEWTTSKLYTTKDGKNYKTGLRGFCGEVSFSQMKQKAYGFGANLYVSRTSDDVKRLFVDPDCSYTLLYAGPSFVVAGKIASRLRLDGAISLGPSFYYDDGQSKVGFGAKTNIGLEFLIKDTFGIGIEAFAFTSSFSRPKDFKQPDNEYYGIRQLGAMFSVRFHY